MVMCTLCGQIQEGSADISIESSDSSSKLTISSGQQEHCGCYTIELRNSFGLRQAALNLTIVGKKKVEHLANHHNHKQLDKSCFFSRSTPNTCSHPYLEVLMIFLLSSDKPDPPAKVPAASDIRRASLTLSWYGPTYDGGSAVMSYHLEIWDSVEQHWKPLVSCNSTSYNVQVNFISQNLNKSWR